MVLRVMTDKSRELIVIVDYKVESVEPAPKKGDLSPEPRHGDSKVFTWPDIGKVTALIPAIILGFQSAVTRYKPPKRFTPSAEIRSVPLPAAKTGQRTGRNEVGGPDEQEQSNSHGCGRLVNVQPPDKNDEEPSRTVFHKCVAGSTKEKKERIGRLR